MADAPMSDGPQLSDGPVQPVAKKVPVEREHHGELFVDDYEWLRDKDDPEVIAYLEGQNAFTAAQTAGQE